MKSLPGRALRLLPQLGDQLLHHPDQLLDISRLIKRGLVFPIALIGNSLRGKSIGGIVIDGNAVSFLLVAIIAQVVSIDAPPFLKKAAWTNILQSSLVLGLWESAAQIKKENDLIRHSERQHLLPMVIAFSLGTIGSVCGTVVGYFFSSRFPHASVSQLIVFTSCLTSSFIGGTVNFFEVAVALNAMRGQLGKSLEMFAASDIGFMVVYFGGLLFLQSSPVAKVLSPRLKLDVEDESTALPLDEKLLSKEYIIQFIKRATSVAELITASLVITLIAGKVQQYLGVAGVSVIVTVLLTLGSIKIFKPSNLEIFSSSTAAGNLMLSLFYATIGIEAGLFEIYKVGLPMLILIVTALFVHITVVIAGSWCWNRMIDKIMKKPNFDVLDIENISYRKYLIDIDTAVVASNACIGGASTAASMASTLGRSDIVLHATIVGVIGYLIGTPIGLHLNKALLLRNTG